MNAGQAARLIAPFIEKSWPANKEEIFRTLRLAVNHAWKAGKFEGMTAEFFMPIKIDLQSQNYILTPPGYASLLAVNVDARPRLLRDKQFMFHRNGWGDIKDHPFCKWTEDVYDLGIQQTLVDVEAHYPDGFILAARSLTETGENERVNITGSFQGTPVVSFTKNNILSGNCNCIQIDEPPSIRTVSGIEINLTRDFTYVSNVKFSSIEAITKTLTRGQVEIVAIDPVTGRGRRIAFLNPWETAPRTKKYHIPFSCRGCVHALFKVDKQPEIVDESQPILIRDEEAIISLAKGIHLVYNKDNPEGGSVYLASGIGSLEKEKQEIESPDTFPIQVVNGIGEQTPEILYFH